MGFAHGSRQRQHSGSFPVRALSHGRGAEPHSSHWELSKDSSSRRDTSGCGVSYRGCAFRLPFTSFSNLLQTNPQMLHVAKSSACPSPARADLGCKLGTLHPWTPLRGSWERSSRAQAVPAAGGTKPASPAAPSPGIPVPTLGCWRRTRTQTCCPPSIFPRHTSPRDGAEHTRRGGSHGYKATTRPTLTPGEPQQGPELEKRQIAINPPAPCRAAPLPSGSQAAACHLLLAAATAQGEVEAAACNTLACLSASPGHDALRRGHHEIPRYHGAQETHRHPPAKDTDKCWDRQQSPRHHEQHKCILCRDHPYGTAQRGRPAALPPSRCLADK